MKTLLTCAFTALISCGCSSVAEPVTHGPDDPHRTGGDAGTGKETGPGSRLDASSEKRDAGDASTASKPAVSQLDAFASSSPPDAALDASPADGLPARDIVDASADAASSADSGRTDLGLVVALHVSPVNINWLGQTALSVSAELRSGATVDVTTEATYESTDSSVAFVDEDGVVWAVSSGSARIIARHADVEAEVLVDLDPQLPQIHISPRLIQLPVGLSGQLAATASEVLTVDVTEVAKWSSSDESIAKVENGLVTGVSPGGTTIIATYEGSSASSLVTITDAVPLSIVISPFDPFVFVGSTRTVQLTSDLHFSDGSIWEGTDAVTWSSGDESVATVTAAGEVSGVNAGQAQIFATFEGLTSSVLIQADFPHLKGIVVDPGGASLRVDQSLVIKAEMRTNDGSVLDISREVDWHTSVKDVVEVTTTEHGTVVQAIGPGLVHVCAVFAGYEDCAEITVLADAGMPKRDAGMP